MSPMFPYGFHSLNGEAELNASGGHIATKVSQILTEKEIKIQIL